MSREFCQRRVAAGKSGAIVTMSSITGMLARDYLAIYGPAKAALIQLAKQVALDMLHHKVRSNVIAPGYFLT